MIHYLAGPKELMKLTEWGSGLGEREGVCWRPRLGLWAWRGWWELCTGEVCSHTILMVALGWLQAAEMC